MNLPIMPSVKPQISIQTTIKTIVMYSIELTVPKVSINASFIKSKPRLKIKPPTMMVGTNLINEVPTTSNEKVAMANIKPAKLLPPPERMNNTELEYTK